MTRIRSCARSVGALVVLALVAIGCGDDGGRRTGDGLAQLMEGSTSSGDGTGASGGSGDGDGDVGDGGASVPPIQWTEERGGWESGSVTVPLDHGEPDGATIEVAVVRRPATSPAERIGVLLLNPGGPGASGIDFAYSASWIFPAEVLERFDVIGFDPRGVGASTPIVCGDSDFLDAYTALDPVPDSPEEAAEAAALTLELAETCVGEHGDLLPHLTTVNTAHDMDAIRAALGEDQITYVGFSYGTYLGSTYLELHPERVRAAVLDGAYSRSIDPIEMAVGQAEGFERSVDAFVAWCQPSRCDLAASGDPETQLLGILARIDRHPVPGNDGRELTVGLAWTAVIMAMYSNALWPILDSALISARDGDGSQLLMLADQYNDRGFDGEYANQTFAFAAIGCADGGPMGDVDMAELESEILAAAPRIGEVYMGLPSPCDHWQDLLDPDVPTGPFSAPDAPPVLVVATTGDPATRYEWGTRLADELVSAVLISVEGSTHTAYGGGNSCVDDVVDAYLLRLDVPSGRVDC